MAISTVVSHRNFGPFIGSGRVCHREPSDCQRCGNSSIGAVQCVNKKMFCSKLYHPRASFSFRYVYQSSSSGRDQPNREVSRSNLTPHVKLDWVPIGSNQTSNRPNSMYKRVKNKGLFACCHSSAYSDAGWIQTRKLDKLGFSNGQKPPSKHSTVMRTRAEFKFEEHDITRTEFEALVLPEGASEAILLEGAELAKPWWNQFPKRWVMVLLCFAAFLLCNMDRVNMSISILPMSKEFNWNSATVGLIQSSFFWGYLLTQIIGGIWADKLGGKLVLGFGVVWWSIATVLTPIAAKIGLPFLLVMRAFMGIGEFADFLKILGITLVIQFSSGCTSDG